MLQRLMLFVLLGIFSVSELQALPAPPTGSLVITQSQWHQQNTQYLANPASVMKLITATLASEVLGPEFQFKTQFHYQPDRLINGRLSSPLQLRLQGDPELTKQQLNALVSRLYHEGVRELDGLIIDTTSYSGHQWSLGQVWNDHGICFAAPITAANIDKNCVYGNIKPTRVGQLAKFHIAEGYPLYFDNQVMTVAKGEAKECDILLLSGRDNHYSLTGCISETTKPLALGFSATDPMRYFADILQDIFKRNRIQLTGSVTFAALPTFNGHILEHRSQPVRQLVSIMLHESDNLIADTLFKQAGMKANLDGLGKGSYHSGDLATKSMLDTLGIVTQQLVIRDGSGLSRENLIYAETLYQLLQRWQALPRLSWLIDSLPVAGESGTIKFRKSLRDDALKSHVIGKSGSMQGVINLAGYIRQKEGLKPFVILGNHIVKEPMSSSVINRLSSQMQFEHDFLMMGMLNE